MEILFLNVFFFFFISAERENLDNVINFSLSQMNLPFYIFVSLGH